MRATVVLLLLVLAAALPFDAQQIGQNAPATNGPSTFSTSSQLVVETVSVKDKSGKPVEGLTAKDFTVTEDGAAQVIKFFEYQKIEEKAAPLPSTDGAGARVVDKLAHTQITGETPGKTRYRDRRLLALYF